MEKNDTVKEKKAKVYEIGYLLVPTVAEERVASEVEIIKSLIEKNEGAFISEDFPKLRPLAYTMKKSLGGGQNASHDNAYFGWIKFETSSDFIPKIKAELAGNSKILRSMLIETVRENTMSSKIMFKPAESLDKTTKENVPAAPVSEAELDKTIDNLVVE